MKNIDHAKKIVELLHNRPETLDSEGFYQHYEDELQMKRIIEKYLNQLPIYSKVRKLLKELDDVEFTPDDEERIVPLMSELEGMVNNQITKS